MISDEYMLKAAARMESAAERAQDAANRMEEAARRIANLLEDGTNANKKEHQFSEIQDMLFCVGVFAVLTFIMWWLGPTRGR